MLPHCGGPGDGPGDPVVQHTGSGSRQSRPGAAGSEQIAQRQLQVKQVRTGSRVLEDSLTIPRQPQRVDCKINFPNRNRCRRRRPRQPPGLRLCPQRSRRQGQGPRRPNHSEYKATADTDVTLTPTSTERPTSTNTPEAVDTSTRVPFHRNCRGQASQRSSRRQHGRSRP